MCKLKINSFCTICKCSYKILADIRQNLLEAKVCYCFVSSHGTYNGNFTVYSLCTNTSENYKMNTFSLNSVLKKNMDVVSTPKMHFPAVPAQDRFYFLNEGELQMNQRNSSNSFYWYLSFYIKYYHNNVSSLVSFLLRFALQFGVSFV